MKQPIHRSNQGYSFRRKLALLILLIFVVTGGALRPIRAAAEGSPPTQGEGLPTETASAVIPEEPTEEFTSPPAPPAHVELPPAPPAPAEAPPAPPAPAEAPPALPASVEAPPAPPAPAEAPPAPPAPAEAPPAPPAPAEAPPAPPAPPAPVEQSSVSLASETEQKQETAPVPVPEQKQDTQPALAPAPEQKQETPPALAPAPERKQETLPASAPEQKQQTLLASETEQKQETLTADTTETQPLSGVLQRTTLSRDSAATVTDFSLVTAAGGAPAPLESALGSGNSEDTATSDGTQLDASAGETGEDTATSDGTQLDASAGETGDDAGTPDVTRIDASAGETGDDAGTPDVTRIDASAGETGEDTATPDGTQLDAPTGETGDDRGATDGAAGDTLGAGTGDPADATLEDKPDGSPDSLDLNVSGDTGDDQTADTAAPSLMMLSAFMSTSSEGDGSADPDALGDAGSMMLMAELAVPTPDPLIPGGKAYLYLSGDDDSTRSTYVSSAVANAVQQAVDAALASAASSKVRIVVEDGVYEGGLQIVKPAPAEGTSAPATGFALDIRAHDAGDDKVSSVGNVQLFGNVNIDSINTALAGLYLSLQSIIKAKSADLEVYGTGTADTIQVEATGAGTAGTVKVDAGAGDDTIQVDTAAVKSVTITGGEGHDDIGVTFVQAPTVSLDMEAPDKTKPDFPADSSAVTGLITDAKNAIGSQTNSTLTVDAGKGDDTVAVEVVNSTGLTVTTGADATNPTGPPRVYGKAQVDLGATNVTVDGGDGADMITVSGGMQAVTPIGQALVGMLVNAVEDAIGSPSGTFGNKGSVTIKGARAMIPSRSIPRRCSLLSGDWMSFLWMAKAGMTSFI